LSGCPYLICDRHQYRSGRGHIGSPQAEIASAAGVAIPTLMEAQSKIAVICQSFQQIVVL
jgi:hypothetical protein